MPEDRGTAAGLLETTLLRPAEFAEIKRLAHEKFGLDLRAGKEQLVSARLGKILRQGGFRSFGEYYRHVIGDPSGEALIRMIDALTTNFTAFLREPAHFDFLTREILPGWRSRREVRIWSAACATGEEPYTLAFHLLDWLQGASLPAIRILATDISSRALETAERGVYPAERFRDLPLAWLPRFLLRGHGHSSGHYKVKAEVRSLIEFRRLNLVEPFGHEAPFALILCRNVMIYFDRSTQQNVVQKLAAALEPGGYLFVGHSESLSGRGDSLEYLRPAIYRKTGAGCVNAGRRRARS